MEEMVTQARNEASPPPERVKPVVHVTRTMKKSPRSPPADAPTKHPDTITLDTSRSPRSDAAGERPAQEAAEREAANDANESTEDSYDDELIASFMVAQAATAGGESAIE